MLSQLALRGGLYKKSKEAGVPRLENHLFLGHCVREKPLIESAYLPKRRTLPARAALQQGQHLEKAAAPFVIKNTVQGRSFSLRDDAYPFLSENRDRRLAGSLPFP